jgi:predicted Mrr-cat superfamily restriction endonuclease
MTHHEDPKRAAEWCRRNGRIALGWACSGDLRTLNATGPADMTRAILAGWPTSHNATPGGRQLWDFLHTMKPGDLVIVSTGAYRAFVAEVTGPYDWSDPAAVPVWTGDYQHQRPVDVTDLDPNVVWRLAGAGTAPGYGVRWTLIRCKNDVALPGV